MILAKMIYVHRFRRSVRRAGRGVCGAGLAAAYLFTNVTGVYAEESRFWAERRAAVRHAKAAPGVEKFPLLTGLPLAVPMDVAAAAPAPRSLDEITALVAPHGRVRAFHPARRAGGPLIVHVQDVHGVEEAQRHIAGIIEALAARRDGLLVGLEGADGAFTLGAYRDWPDASLTRNIADYFLKQGWIGGPEHAALSAPRPPQLWGIEDRRLYGENVRALQDGLRDRAAVRARLAGLTTLAASLKDRIYSPDLQEFDHRSAAYQGNRESLGAYVRWLANAPPRLPLSKNMRLLLEALAAEETLDFQQVEKDRLALAKSLAQRLSKRDLSELAARGLDHRLGRLGYGDYHLFLRQLCQKNGVDLDGFGSVGAYVRYVAAADRIDRNALLDELAALERAVQDALARTPAQRRLVAAARGLALLDRLAGHAMTPDDWAAYEAHRDEVLGAPAELVSLAEGPADPASLAEVIKPFEDFCRLALSRNTALADNLLAKLGPDGGPAVLVAGGFHTEGLARLLADRGAGCLVVTPTVTEISREAHLDVFAHDALPLEKLFRGETISLVRPVPFADAAPEDARFAAMTEQVKSLWRAFQELFQTPARRAAVGRSGHSLVESADGRIKIGGGDAAEIVRDSPLPVSTWGLWARWFPAWDAIRRVAPRYEPRILLASFTALVFGWGLIFPEWEFWRLAVLSALGAQSMNAALHLWAFERKKEGPQEELAVRFIFRLRAPPLEKLLYILNAFLGTDLLFHLPFYIAVGLSPHMHWAAVWALGTLGYLWARGLHSYRNALVGMEPLIGLKLFMMARFLGRLTWAPWVLAVIPGALWIIAVAKSIHGSNPMLGRRSPAGPFAEPAPEPILITERWTSDGPVVYEERGPMVFAVPEKGGRRAYLRLRRETTRPGGPFVLARVQPVVADPVFHPRRVVFAGTGKRERIVRIGETLSIGSLQLTLSLEKNRHLLALRDTGSTEAPTAVLKDIKLAGGEDLSRPVSFDGWHRAGAVVELVGERLAAEGRADTDHENFRFRLEALVEGWRGLSARTKRVLVENIMAARGWKNRTLTDPETAYRDSLKAAIWLRRFFEKYRHVFYLIPDNPLRPELKGVVVLARMRWYRLARWRGFRTVVYADPVLTSQRVAEGITLNLDTDHSIVLLDGSSLDEDLIALHETHHAHDFILYADHGIRPAGWELEYTAFLRTLVEICRINAAAERGGLPRPYGLAEALSGESALQRYIQISTERKGRAHAEAFRKLWPVLMGKIEGRLGRRGLSFDPGDPHQLTAYLQHMEKITPTPVMLEVAEEMLRDFYIQKLGYAPRYPNVMEAPLFPVLLPSPEVLWDAKGLGRYLRMLYDSKPHQFQNALAVLLSLASGDQSPSPLNVIRAVGFFAQPPQGVLADVKDLAELFQLSEKLEAAARSRYEPLSNGLRAARLAYESSRSRFQAAGSPDGSPIPLAHVPLISTSRGREGGRPSPRSWTGRGLLLTALLTLLPGCAPLLDRALTTGIHSQPPGAASTPAAIPAARVDETDPRALAEWVMDTQRIDPEELAMINGPRGPVVSLAEANRPEDVDRMARFIGVVLKTPDLQWLAGSIRHARVLVSPVQSVRSSPRASRGGLERVMLLEREDARRAFTVFLHRVAHAANQWQVIHKLSTEKEDESWALRTQALAMEAFNREFREDIRRGEVRGFSSRAVEKVIYLASRMRTDPTLRPHGPMPGEAFYSPLQEAREAALRRVQETSPGLSIAGPRLIDCGPVDFPGARPRYVYRFQFIVGGQAREVEINTAQPPPAVPPDRPDPDHGGADQGGSLGLAGLDREDLEGRAPATAPSAFHPSDRAAGAGWAAFVMGLAGRAAARAADGPLVFELDGFDPEKNGPWAAYVAGAVAAAAARRGAREGSLVVATTSGDADALRRALRRARPSGEDWTRGLSVVSSADAAGLYVEGPRLSLPVLRDHLDGRRPAKVVAAAEDRLYRGDLTDVLFAPFPSPLRAVGEYLKGLARALISA